MLGKLRERYEIAISPVGRYFSSIGLTANTMSALSLVVSAMAGLAYLLGSLIAGAGLLAASGVLDMFDGAIARARGVGTRFGAVLDHVLDRYAEYFVLAGIVIGGYADWFWAVFALIGMLMASFTRAKAESVGGLSSCTVGVAERQEKLILIIAGSILSLWHAAALFYAVVLVGVLSHVTVVQRLAYTWRHTRGAARLGV